MACSGAVRREPLAVTLLALLLATACTAAEGEPTPTPVEQRATSAAPSPKPRPRPYTISFAGDVHFEGILRTRLDRDPRTALGPIAAVLRKSDLTALNLETAITTGGRPAPGKQYTFRARPRPSRR